MKLRAVISLLLFNLVFGYGFARQAANKPLVVDGAGSGDFKTLQAAINSLPDSAVSDRLILVRKGVYHEKVFITKNHLVIAGESESNTILTCAIARDIWRCEGHADDWGTATLNLRGSDLTFKNLSIINSYGFNHLKDSLISCTIAGATNQRNVQRNGHQMALRSFQTTRLKMLHCTIRAYGGDTVSPWNTLAGLFYFKDCTMEGSVDLYCPRGWAYAENCHFICHSTEAAIWHDGSANPQQKSVLKDCTFTGDDGFKLGRYHKDAQLYLINCKFARNMADVPIYQATSSTGVKWGKRVYYFDCHHDGGYYSWLKNNLNEAPGEPVAGNINAQWALDQQWNPLLN